MRKTQLSPQNRTADRINPSIVAISLIPTLPVALLTLSATADGWHQYPLLSNNIYTREYFPTLPGMPLLARFLNIGGNPYIAWQFLSVANFSLIALSTGVLLRRRDSLTQATGVFTATATFLLLNIESPRGWNHTSLSLFWFGTSLLVDLYGSTSENPSSTPWKVSRVQAILVGFFLSSSVLIKHSQALAVVALAGSIVILQTSRQRHQRPKRIVYAYSALGAVIPTTLVLLWAARNDLISPVVAKIFSQGGKEQGFKTWLGVFFSELTIAPTIVGAFPLILLLLCVLLTVTHHLYPYNGILSFINASLFCFVALIIVGLGATTSAFLVCLGAFMAHVSVRFALVPKDRVGFILLLWCVVMTFTLMVGATSHLGHLIPLVARRIGSVSALSSVVLFGITFARYLLGKVKDVSLILLVVASLSQVFIVSKSGVMHGAVFAPFVGFAVGKVAALNGRLLLSFVAAASLGFAASARYSEPMTWWGFREPSISTSIRPLDFEWGGKVLLTGRTSSYWRHVDGILATLPRQPEDRVFSYPVNPIFVSISGIRAADVPCPVVWFDLCPERLKRQTLRSIKARPPEYLIWADTGSLALSAHEYNFNDGEESVLREFESWLRAELESGRYSYAALIPAPSAGSYTWTVYSRVSD